MKIRIFCASIALISSAASGFAETHQVLIVSDYENLRFRFEPQVLTIQPGDTVQWTNQVAEEHNVIAYPGGFPKGALGFESPYLQDAGETFEHTFEVAGTYQYHCLPHLLMGMRAEVIVGHRTEAADMHEPSRAELTAYRTALLEWFDDDDNLLQIRADDKETREHKDH